MCIFIVDILGICAFSWWISWANVHFHGGYLGQMCIMWISWVYVHYYANILLNSEERRRKVSGFCMGEMGVPGGTPVDSYL
jgi:hypothetical protein